MGLFVQKKSDGRVRVSSSPDFKSPPPSEHNFATNWIRRNLTTGVLSVVDGRIIIHSTDEDVIYNIVREPGAYCTHCGERLGDGPATTPDEAAERVAYVKACEVALSNKKTGDPRFQHGIEVADYFKGVLDEEERPGLLKRILEWLT